MTSTKGNSMKMGEKSAFAVEKPDSRGLSQGTLAPAVNMHGNFV